MPCSKPVVQRHLGEGADLHMGISRWTDWGGGANFIHPHPCKYHSRGGGCIKEGGRIKILLQGGLKNTHLPPLSLKNAFWPRCENNYDHSHPSYLQKYAPQICRTDLLHKNRLKSRDFYRKYGIRTPKMWHTNPPPLMPYKPFLLGWGWCSTS